MVSVTPLQDLRSMVEFVTNIVVDVLYSVYPSDGKAFVKSRKFMQILGQWFCSPWSVTPC